MKTHTKQYPGWLTKKKGELPEDEWQQRNEQYMILCRVCELYETQKTPQDNIQEIVILIEKMGQAPQELIDESAAAAPAGSPGEQMNGLPADCTLMWYRPRVFRLELFPTNLQIWAELRLIEREKQSGTMRVFSDEIMSFCQG